MTVYRYLFRDSDGDVVRLERAEYADDEIAVLWGARLLKRSQYRDYEVWCGTDNGSCSGFSGHQEDDTKPRGRCQSSWLYVSLGLEPAEIERVARSRGRVSRLRRGRTVARGQGLLS